MILLDFITSKIVMMIAAIIILTSVLGIFAMQREDAKELELRNITDKISGTVNNINTVLGETKETITFTKGEDGIFLNPKVEGKTYEIIITRYEVIVKQEGKIFLSDFVVNIHLWEPENIAYNLTHLQNKDEENTKLDFTSGEDFIIHRKLIEIDGEKGYTTFVYLSRG
jgi:hypothetical protein